MMNRRRAVKDDQKEARRQMILAVAWQQFQETAYHAVTMNSVAEQAGLAKGTVYLYFNTKEELFLALQEQQLQAWFDDIDMRLQAAAERTTTIPTIVDLLSSSLEQRQGLTRLLAILHTILEHNIERDTAIRFKRMLLTHVARTGALLEQCLPFLESGQGAQLLIRIHALVIGLQHLADPAPIVRDVLREHDLQIFNIDFGNEFARTIRALLYGLQHESSRSSS
jgi:AcrR family transcriptional regulator